MSTEELHEKWTAWLEQIEHETMTLWLYREYWRGLTEITQANDLPPSTFFDALGVWYAATQLAAVRRQLDHDMRSVSFWRLLTEMSEHPEVMTRERHVVLWDDENHWAEDWMREPWLARARENYDRFAEAGNDTIAPRRTLQDRAELEDLAQPLREYVNRRIAHTAETELQAVPTFGELNAAVDKLGDLLQKYVSLFRAAALVQVAPEIQEDWLAPFRVPWNAA